MITNFSKSILLLGVHEGKESSKCEWWLEPLALFNLMSFYFLCPCPCPNSCTLKFTHNPFSDIIGWQQVPCPSRIFKDLDARYFVIKVFQGWSSKILKIQGEDEGNVFKENLNQFKVYKYWNIKGLWRFSLKTLKFQGKVKGSIFEDFANTNLNPLARIKWNLPKFILNTWLESIFQYIPKTICYDKNIALHKVARCDQNFWYTFSSKSLLKQPFLSR